MHARARTRTHITTCAGPRIKEGSEKVMHKRENVMDMKNMMHTKNIMHKRENLMQQKKLNARTTVC